jgi:hypothetical protein
MTKCARCDRKVEDDDIRWRNPLSPVAKDQDGFLQLGTAEYTSSPGQDDPGAAPYCSTCRAEMDAEE